MSSTEDEISGANFEAPLTKLPFPPTPRSHILHCSYAYWHPLYRAITPKARLITLSPAFLSYLRADGIVLPSSPTSADIDLDSGIYSSDASSTASSEDEMLNPAVNFVEIHQRIKETIVELGGQVAPKLNWSAPKDATWINTGNSMCCREAGDVYLLLKSSDFISHDLEYTFDGCTEDDKEGHDSNEPTEDEEHPLDHQIPWTLVLRKWIEINPSVEFRCFVRQRVLIGICQRDPNHFEFLFRMENKLRERIQNFLDEKLNFFPDENFVFDVYIPPPHQRVWLIDINPWAPRTDPLLFSWLELLTMEIPTHVGKISEERSLTADAVQTVDDSESDEALFTPEFRLIKRDDPEAYGFNTQQYSAHKLPKEVVDASLGGTGALRDFAERWKDIVRRQEEDEKRARNSNG